MPRAHHLKARELSLENPRKCIKCGDRKPLEEFNLAKNCLLGRNYECKKCANKRQREWRNKQIRENQDFVNRRHLSQQKILARRSGLSLEEYLKLTTETKTCQVCGSGPSMNGKPHNRLHADHNHVTGKFRGMLCGPCNVVLGLVKDNPQTLLDLAEYLRCNTC